jgi:predicted nucleic acid-binding Zn ribbon protein
MPRIRIELQPTTERIIFNGVPYRRYPNSPKLELRNYFICSKGKDNRVRRLHQAIWEFHNGPIPEGHHVHHKDGDTLNNDISNLECLSNKEHRRMHWTPEESERARKHAERIRPLAKAWHASDEGKDWHSEHSRKIWEQRVPEERTCAVCKSVFLSKTRRKTDKYCSQKCKFSTYISNGPKSTCPQCGNEFQNHMYQPRECCSGRCAKLLMHKRRREAKLVER